MTPRPRYSSTPWIELLARIIAGTPKLDGAACAGRPDLFAERDPDEPDDDADYRHDAALRTCRRCPALVACQEWTDSLPRTQRPPGVVGGTITPSRPVGRPRKEIAR